MASRTISQVAGTALGTNADRGSFCIPAAIVLALRLRRFAVVIAVVLSAVFCGKVPLTCQRPYLVRRIGDFFL